MSASRILCNFVLSLVWTASSIVCVAQLSSTGVVSKTVFAPDGNPVSDAVVTLSGIDGPAHTVSSAADGSFLIKELPSGSYTLKAAAAGFAPHDESPVVVAVGRTTHLSTTRGRRHTTDCERQRGARHLRRLANLLRREHRPGPRRRAPDSEPQLSDFRPAISAGGCCQSCAAAARA